MDKLDHYLFYFLVILLMTSLIYSCVEKSEIQETINKDEIRLEIKDSLQIAKDRITSGIGGNGVSTKEEVDRRFWIMENATKSELLNLTYFPDGTVRAIAYEGLLRKEDYVDKAGLILRALQDTTYYLKYQSGCIGSMREIGCYLVEDFLHVDENRPPPLPERQINIKLTEEEEIKILSLYRERPRIQY